MSVPRLSIVIPAYNEAARLPPTLARIVAWTRARDFACEIVVVDDGSRDGTAELAEAALAGVEHRVLRHESNRGKGAGLATGMTAARGEFVLMTDADLSTPIDELARLVAAIDAGADVAIGSRKMAGAVIEEHQPWLRESMGRVFTALTRLLVVDVSDVTCGFKLFRRDAAEAVFSRATLDDWSFDAEALFLTRRLGFTLVEVPVRWRDAAGTKVSRGRDALRSAIGLARIVWNRMRGRYPAPAGETAAADGDVPGRRRA